MSSNCIISKQIPLADTVSFFLYDYESTDGETCQSFETIGGIFSNSKFVWYANGPRFQVIELRTGKKVASWVFGSILKDTTTKVICLAEIPCLTKEIPLLVLGVEYALTGAVICIFDTLTSRILRAIQINDKVSYIHVIDCGNNIFPILGPLKAFDGVVAVGLVGGDVLLIDLCYQCIDEARVVNSIEDIKGEIDPCQIILLTATDINNIEDYKQKATELGNHLAICLNVVPNTKSRNFTLKGPKGEDRIHVNKAEVLVTSLFYSSQLGSLLVGYNFGAWQIWNLINMKLTYTSPVYEENTPVSHFTVQEPADDPRAFCYVWTVYSNTEQHDTGFPIAVLYSLNYETKDFHEGYGYLYQDLQSCAVRFQTELTAVKESSKTAKGACCLRLTAFNNGCSRTSMPESHEETLTICSIVWNVWHNKGVDTYMGVFDLNQWYKEQMPSSPQQSSYRFFAHICISDLLNDSSSDSPLLDVLIDETTINQFIGIQKPEEHYYPTALAYEFSTCSDKNITLIYNKGQQRTLLGYIKRTGPLILLKPKEVFQQSIKLGLTPLFVDSVVLDLNLQREFLLNIALEQQMIGFLYNCIATWSNGSYASMGCSLEFLLNWSWNRAVVLKTNTDSLCETLFDYSEGSLDTNNQRVLNSCIRQLSSLDRLYEYICKTIQLDSPSINVVRQQKDCLHMIVTYLEVLQWLMNIGLLPECSENSVRKTYSRADWICAPYPIESLLAYYRQKRSTYSKKPSLLYIDNLLENEFGGTVQKIWEEDGGNGHYPPPSLQSLLRTYLIENVDITYKHCIVVYLFLDLAVALDQSRYKFIVTNLIKFPAVFKITNSLTKIIQAFWQLDHGDFRTAMDQILDPLINPADLKQWHHQMILNTLLEEGQYNFALLYFQVRRPPLESTQDILKILSLYIHNHMIDEAINFSRQHSSQNNDAKLISHVFQECKETDQILKFVYYPLNQKEEEILMKYLEDVFYEYFEEFRVSYYLHRSRYMDIIQMRNKEDVLQPSGLKAQKEIGCYDGAMKAITNLFPKVTRDILSVCRHDKNIGTNEFSRPKPMSVYVHNAKEQAKYKSTLIRAGILKTKEIWTHPVLEKSMNTELPFVRTPILCPSTSRKRPSIITPKIINTSDDNSLLAKKLRLSTVSANNALSDVNELSSASLLDTSRILTPIVKRKVQLQKECDKSENEKFNVSTPQSILKVRNLVMSESSSALLTATPNATSRNFSMRRNTSALGLTPRRSFSRSVVRFEKSNESFTDPSLDKTTELTNSSNSPRRSDINRSSSQSVDAFYSPNASGNMENMDSEGDPSISKEDAVANIQANSQTSKVETDLTEIEASQVERISPRGRSSYRDISPGIVKESIAEDLLDKHSKIDIANNDSETKASPIIKTCFTHKKSQETAPPLAARRRSTRGKSAEPATEWQPSPPLSPRRTSLRIRSRESFNSNVSERSTSDFAHRDLKSEFLNESNGKLSSLDDSSSSALAFRQFDQMCKDQSFGLPHISLSPMQYSTSIESNLSSVTGTSEQLVSNSHDTIEIQGETCTIEKKQQRRSSFKIQRRKSLSRMVLERNACSLHTSTPSHRLIETDNKDLVDDSSRESINFEGISAMTSLEQQELDRMMKEQPLNVPHFSFSPNQTSVDSNITQDHTSENSIDNAITNNEYSQEDGYKNFEISKSLNSSVNRDAEINRSGNNDTVSVSEPIQRNTELPSCIIQSVETVAKIEEGITSYINDNIVEEAIVTTNPLETGIDNAELIEEPTSELLHSDETSVDKLNKAIVADSAIIEILDSSSDSNRSVIGSSNSSANISTYDEDSIATIHTDFEEEANESAESEEANIAVIKDLEEQEEFESNEELVLSERNEIQCQSSTLENDGNNYALEAPVDLIENNADIVGIDNNTLASNCTDVQIESSELMEAGSANKDAGDNVECVTLPQVDMNSIVELNNALNQPMSDTIEENNDKYNVNEESNSGINIFDDVTIEPSNFEEVPATDILDVTDIEKTMFVNISSTDILDESLTVSLNDSIDNNMMVLTKTEVNEVTALSNISETENHDKAEIARKKETSCNENVQQYSNDTIDLGEDPQKMRLRKRTLSNTLVESSSIRTLRKRSASVDQINSSFQHSALSPSGSKCKASQKQVKKLELDKNAGKSARTFRNRRAASVSECVSHEREEQPKNDSRSKKKTRSVINLPVISEEAAAVSKDFNTNESKKSGDDENQSLIDELDNYSSSRRLTRNQKHLLERSKRKQSTPKKSMVDELLTLSEEGTTIAGDRIRTRRMSQDSTSSIISTVTSTSDTGSPRKRKRETQKPHTVSQGPKLRSTRSRSVDEVSVSSQISSTSRRTRKSEATDSDDQSTSTLRRSTRQRSKTPDIAHVGRSTKSLTMISEETNDGDKRNTTIGRQKKK